MATHPVFDTLEVLGSASLAEIVAPSHLVSASSLNTSAPISKVTNGTTTSGNTLLFATTTGITNGMTAYGTGIPDGAVVTATTSNSVQVDQVCNVALGVTVNFIGISVVAAFSGPVADDYRIRLFDYRYAAGNSAATATRRIGFASNGNPAGFIDFNPAGTPVMGIGAGPPYASNYGLYINSNGTLTLPKGATISAPALMTVAYASGANPVGLKHVFNFSTSPIDNAANPTLFQTNITTTTNNHEVWANFDSTVHNVPGGDPATSGNIVSRYVQAIRYTDSHVPLSALIANAIDATGHASSLGGPLSGLEVDVTANGLDDASGRRGLEIALGKYDNGAARPEARAAIEIYSGSNTIQEIGGYGFHLIANIASPFRDAGLDFRGATAWAGAGTGTDMAIRFRSGHKFVWDTSANAVQRYNATTGNLEISGIGGWGSTNVGRQLVLTTPNGFSNPALGITDATGANIWAVQNNSGSLRFSRMPALTDSTTAPVDILSLGASGSTFSGGVALAGNLYDIRLSGVDVTGVADAQSALQSWLNTLPKGSTVRIPAEAKILISAADLTIPPGIAIEGEAAMLETGAGIAGGLLFGPAFLLTPTTTLVMSSGSTLRGVKVLRNDLLPAPTTAQINSAIAQWASEGLILYTSIIVASGNVLTFPSTTGVTIGMQVRGDGLVDSMTVTGVTATTVTLSTNVFTTVSAQAAIRFGRSIAVRVPRNTGGAALDNVMIVGFHTAIYSGSGRMWFNRIAADCNTILFFCNGGDASYITNIHAVPWYGSVSGAGNNRVGPAFIFNQSDGSHMSGLTQVGWNNGFLLANTSGARMHHCWSECGLNNDGLVTLTAFKTQGIINVCTLSECTASGPSVAFDLQHTGGHINLIGCISSCTNDSRRIAHYRFGPSSAGAVTGAMLNVQNTTPFAVQSGAAWWRIVAPMLAGALVPSPWITGAAADLAKVQMIMVKDQLGLINSVVQTHLQEKTWVSWDTSIASTDSSPTEALAVESLASGTSYTSVQSWFRNGTKVASVRSGPSLFGFVAGTSTDFEFLADTKHSFYVGGTNAAFNIQAHSGSVATDYVQLGPETGGGGYVTVISQNANAPLAVGTGNAGILRLQPSGGAMTIGGNATVAGTLGVTGVTTLGTASITNATVSGTATIATASITNATVSATATLAAATVSGNATVGGTLGVTGAATLGSATITNNASIGGTLGVTGTATLSTALITNATVSGTATLAAANLSGNATVGGTLGVTGAASFGSTVLLAGVPTLPLQAATKGYVDAAVTSSGIADAPSNGTTYGRSNAAWVAVLPLTGGTVSGATTFGSTLGVTGAASLSTLGTSGLATLNSASVSTTLGVTGATTLSSTVAINSILTVGTNIASLAAPLVINSAATAGRQIRWQTAGLARWGWGLSSAAEAGSNAGADLALSAYSDTGLLLSQPIIVTRSTGQITINGGLKASGSTGFFGANPTVRQTVTGSRGGNVALANLLIAMATLGLITDSTTA